VTWTFSARGAVRIFNNAQVLTA